MRRPCCWPCVPCVLRACVARAGGRSIRRSRAAAARGPRAERGCRLDRTSHIIASSGAITPEHRVRESRRERTGARGDSAGVPARRVHAAGGGEDRRDDARLQLRHGRVRGHPRQLERRAAPALPVPHARARRAAAPERQDHAHGAALQRRRGRLVRRAAGGAIGLPGGRLHPADRLQVDGGARGAAARPRGRLPALHRAVRGVPRSGGGGALRDVVVAAGGRHLESPRGRRSTGST